MIVNKPRVSIGLPVYNGERYIEEAIDSILGQTYTDFELIISDNASTDRTPEICRAYTAKDSRIRYFRNRKILDLPQTLIAFLRCRQENTLNGQLTMTLSLQLLSKSAWRC